MNRTQITVLMAGGVLLIALAFWQILTPPYDVTVVPTLPAANGRNTDQTKNYDKLRERLGWEERRLLELQRSLSEVEARQENAEQVNEQVAALEARITETRQQIAARREERARLESDAQAFKRERELANNDEQLLLESQILAIDNSIFDLQIQAQQAQASGLPPQAPVFNELRSRITQLEMQKRQLASASRATEIEARTDMIVADQDLSDLRVQVHTEEQNLLRLQADLSSELEYWKQQQRAFDNPLREQRLASLRREVERQQEEVAALQNTIY